MLGGCEGWGGLVFLFSFLWRGGGLRDGRVVVGVAGFLAGLGVEEEGLELVELGDDVAALEDVVEFFLWWGSVRVFIGWFEGEGRAERGGEILGDMSLGSL